MPDLQPRFYQLCSHISEPTVYRRIIIAVLFLLLILAIGLGARQVPTLDRLIEQEQVLREVVRTQPLVSWLIGLLAYTLVSMIPGTSGKAIVCGWLFGFVPAVLMVNLGLTAAAIVAFAIGRWAWRNLERKRLPQWIVRGRNLLDGDRVQHHASTYLLGLRLLHAPYTLINYGAAATTVPLKTFWWTTQIGTLPGIIVFTFAGTRIPTLAVVTEQGAASLLDPSLLAALFLMTILPALVHQMFQRKKRNANKPSRGTTASTHPKQSPEQQSSGLSPDEIAE